MRTHVVATLLSMVILAGLAQAQARGGAAMPSPSGAPVTSAFGSWGPHPPAPAPPLRSMSDSRLHQRPGFNTGLTPAVCTPFAGCFTPTFAGNPSRHSAFFTPRTGFFGQFPAFWPYGYGYGLPYPYTQDEESADVENQQSEEALSNLYDDQRRQLELERQLADQRAADARSARTAPSTTVPSETKRTEAAATPPAIMVLRDGRRLQLQNYVVTRDKIYTVGGQQPVILVSELDVAATMKANQDAGVPFRLPGASSQTP